MQLAVDEKGNLLFYMNKKWVSKEEALKIYPTHIKEECDAIRQKWEQSLHRT